MLEKKVHSTIQTSEHNSKNLTKLYIDYGEKMTAIAKGTMDNGGISATIVFNTLGSLE